MILPQRNQNVWCDYYQIAGSLYQTLTTSQIFSAWHWIASLYFLEFTSCISAVDLQLLLSFLKVLSDDAPWKIFFSWGGEIYLLPGDNQRWKMLSPPQYQKQQYLNVLFFSLCCFWFCEAPSSKEILKENTECNTSPVEWIALAPPIELTYGLMRRINGSRHHSVRNR